MSDIVLTDQNFKKEVLESEKPILVDFWAVWCGPCRAQDPILEEIGKSFSEKASIAKLNVDENPATAEQYGVMSIPTLMIFKGGQLVKQFVGVQSKETLTSELNKAMN